MAALSFLSNHRPSLTAIYFHHETEHGEIAHQFINNYCNQHRIPLIVGRLKADRMPKESQEEFWRNQRYTFLHNQPHLIATAHHLDDAAETYLWGCIHGQPRFIHYQQPGPTGPTNIARPFLLTSKQSLLDWCLRHQIPFLQDPSNNDVNYVRNRIRHNILPEVLKANPGFLTIIKKLVSQQLVRRTDVVR